MKKLILYLHGGIPFEFPYGVNTKAPWTFGVNSVTVDRIDPFYTKLMVPSFQEILTHKSNKDFETLCFERAEEIRSLGLPIFIQYSGGTDSTCVLLSILRSWPKADLDRVYILMTLDSVIEFPELWPEIRDTFEGKIFDAREEGKHFHSQGYVVNGEGGDQLFGSIILENLIKRHSEEVIHSYWMSPIFHKFLVDFESDVDECATFLRKYQQTLDYCPFPLETVFDVAWWWNYTNKLQSVAYRGLTYDTSILKTYQERNISFFITKDFLRWSLDNHDKKIKDNYLSYKWIAKQFIEKNTGLQEHWTRPKVGSLDMLWNFGKKLTHFEYATIIDPLKIPQRQIAIDEDFNYLTIEETRKLIRNV